MNKRIKKKQDKRNFIKHKSIYLVLVERIAKLKHDIMDKNFGKLLNEITRYERKMKETGLFTSEVLSKIINESKSNTSA
ncbi:MAG: hypothetical protein HRT43_11115 [Campylobacteraceae bacterium]|nr:hypothetical protein [Campylobacteraceae bacterium]